MSINIKINQILMAAVLLLTFSVVSEAAELSIGNYTVNESEQITSQIELKDVVNFGTATISLLYDPLVVEVTTVSNGNIPSTTMTNNINFPVNGSTRILVFTSDVPGPNGSFIFSNISLKAVGNGGSQSSLSISVQEFADTDGQPINYTVRNGTFSIKSTENLNVTPTPTPTLTPTSTSPPTSTPTPTATPVPTPTPTPTQTPIPSKGSISGLNINDLNGNGRQNTGEKGLPGWNIKLIGIVPGTVGINMETTTDTNGFYSFENLPAGMYLLVETLQGGYVPTGSPVVVVNLGKGTNSINNNFTNRPVSSLIPDLSGMFR